MHRMLPGTRALRTFEAAGRLLNFTQAAKELGLTPAAVSYQIKEIEDQLELTLFVRSSRSMALTPAGMLLFDAAADALQTLHHALARARRLQQQHAPLRVSVGPRFATQWLLPRLAQWRTAHPDIELSFDISDRVRDFDRDEVDLAIRFGAGNDAGTHTVRLFDTVVVAVCSPALLAGARWTAPRELLGQTLCQVDCEVGGRPWPNWAMWMAEAGVADADAHASTSACVGFADSGHVLHAVLAGSSVGLLELAMIRKELAQGTLVRLFDIALPVAPRLAYHLVYPDSSGEDRRIATFQAWLLRQLAA